MTATEVNGLRVVHASPTISPLKPGPDGKPIVWKQTKTLVLEDGSVVYGCVHCDYTNVKVGAVRPHLTKHSTKPRKPRVVKIKPTGNAQVDALVQTITEAVDKDRQIEHWKERALRAERANKDINAALAKLGFPVAAER